jgi:hypothetical protein
MKNLDLMSKRILTIAFSLSMVLLAAACFVYSINSLSAKNNPIPAPKITPAVASENYCPLGISNGYVYYFFLNGSTAEFSKVNVTVAKDFSENYK